MTPTADTNWVGCHDPLSDVWVLSPQAGDHIGHLCGILQAGDQAPGGRARLLTPLLTTRLERSGCGWTSEPGGSAPTPAAERCRTDRILLCVMALLDRNIGQSCPRHHVPGVVTCVGVNSSCG